MKQLRTDVFVNVLNVGCDVRNQCGDMAYNCVMYRVENDIVDLVGANIRRNIGGRVWDIIGTIVWACVSGYVSNELFTDSQLEAAYKIVTEK
jgi:hypothetical protein